MVLFLAILIVLGMLLYAGSAVAWGLVRLAYAAVALVLALFRLAWVMLGWAVDARQMRREGDRRNAA